MQTAEVVHVAPPAALLDGEDRMPMDRRLVLAVVGCTLALAGTAAHADLIDVYGTGVDAGHAVLPGGSVDPHYALTTRSDGDTGTVAYVVNDGYPISPNGP